MNGSLDWDARNTGGHKKTTHIKPGGDVTCPYCGRVHTDRSELAEGSDYLTWVCVVCGEAFLVALFPGEAREEGGEDG